MKWIYVLLIFSFPFSTIGAQDSIFNSFNNSKIIIGRNAFIAKDTTNKVTADKALTSLTFVKNSSSVINLGVSPYTYWIKFSVVNKSATDGLMLNIAQPNIDHITLYDLTSPTSSSSELLGNAFDFNNRNYNNQNFVFNLNVPINQSKTFLLKVKSSTQLILPLQINNVQGTFENLSKTDLLFGIFFGIVCAMFFYNLFIYFTVQDYIYIYYVIYILLATISQCTMQGYAFKYFWPHSTWLATNGMFVFTNLGGIAAVMFTKKFLHAKSYVPKWNAAFSIVIWLFILSIVLMLLDEKLLSFTVMQTTTLIGSIMAIIIAINVLRKGYAPAKFFLFAWMSLLVGATIYVLKDYGVLPINVFTTNTIEFGFALEVILLSFALADKINVYKKEKEISQAESLRILKENEKLIQEQNQILEKKITERTADLEKTLRELKDAQIQLVESEKMASLGQLTAGIAHEINNPINFVKSNVSPLQMDVRDLFELIGEYQTLHGCQPQDSTAKLQDIKMLEQKLDPDFLKEEIENLIGGIEEGAERTAEIVRGLRNFSRLDESEIKEVNIYDNLNSTLILLRNMTPHYVKIRKHFDAPGQIECYPGKLNQVFMNILTNCIQAIEAKPVKEKQEYIDISVTEVEEHMRIEIKDTGIGMSEEVKHKIFDPFFTTKDVGEGTGLGMAIVFKIIEKHQGKISVASTEGQGATFTIDISYMLKYATELVNS